MAPNDESLVPAKPPPPDVLAGRPAIGITHEIKLTEIPVGMSCNDMLGYIANSPERTENFVRLADSVTGNLERLIFAATGLLALGVGAISALMIYSPHLRPSGAVGLASAGVAGLISAIRLWRRRRRRARKPSIGQGNGVRVDPADRGRA